MALTQFFLGCSQQDITKLIPKLEDRKRYNKRTLSLESSVMQTAKKPRIDPSTFELDDTSDSQFITPQEANEQFILENLTLEKAVYLIFTHIPKLPNTIPPNFVADYQKYFKGGNVGKIALANVLAEQFTDANVGPGAKIVVKERTPEITNKKREREPEEAKEEKEKVGLI